MNQLVLGRVLITCLNAKIDIIECGCSRKRAQMLITRLGKGLDGLSQYNSFDSEQRHFEEGGTMVKSWSSVGVEEDGW